MTEAKGGGIPRIDPDVQFVGASKLRKLNASTLRDLDKTLVIQDSDNKPLAVVLSYDRFLEIQDERDRILATLNLFVDEQERGKFIAGLREVAAKKSKPISVIRDELKKKGK